MFRKIKINKANTLYAVTGFRNVSEAKISLVENNKNSLQQYNPRDRKTNFNVVLM